MKKPNPPEPPVNPKPPYRYPSLLLSSFENHNKQDQNNDQNDNNSHMPPVIAVIPPRDPPNLSPCPIQGAGLSIRRPLALVKHDYMLIQLVAYLHTKLALAADAVAQGI